MKIPNPVIIVVASALSEHYTHAGLNDLFMEAGAAGDIPVGNKMDKCAAWLKTVNQDVNRLSILGRLLENYLELETPEDAEGWRAGREKVRSALARYGLVYHQGGKVISSSGSTPIATLNEIIRRRDLPAVEEEFQRALEFCEAKPESAVTAACALIEALCKSYITEEGLQPP